LTLIRPARKAREPTDAEVQAIIDLYPDGAPLQVIGDVLGVTRSRADQIVKNAIASALRIFRQRNLHGAAYLPDDRDSTEQGIGYFGDSYDGSH
jgi:hypothetical protein